jgi:hypothetical protein
MLRDCKFYGTTNKEQILSVVGGGKSTAIFITVGTFPKYRKFYSKLYINILGCTLLENDCL